METPAHRFHVKGPSLSTGDTGSWGRGARPRRHSRKHPAVGIRTHRPGPRRRGLGDAAGRPRNKRQPGGPGGRRGAGRRSPAGAGLTCRDQAHLRPRPVAPGSPAAPPPDHAAAALGDAVTRSAPHRRPGTARVVTCAGGARAREAGRRDGGAGAQEPRDLPAAPPWLRPEVRGRGGSGAWPMAAGASGGGGLRGGRG